MSSSRSKKEKKTKKSKREVRLVFTPGVSSTQPPVQEQVPRAINVDDELDWKQFIASPNPELYGSFDQEPMDFAPVAEELPTQPPPEKNAEEPTDLEQSALGAFSILPPEKIADILSFIPYGRDWLNVKLVCKRFLDYGLRFFNCNRATDYVFSNCKKHAAKLLLSLDRFDILVDSVFHLSLLNASRMKDIEMIEMILTSPRFSRDIRSEYFRALWKVHQFDEGLIRMLEDDRLLIQRPGHMLIHAVDKDMFRVFGAIFDACSKRKIQIDTTRVITFIFDHHGDYSFYIIQLLDRMHLHGIRLCETDTRVTYDNETMPIWSSLVYVAATLGYIYMLDSLLRHKYVTPTPLDSYKIHYAVITKNVVPNRREVVLRLLADGRFPQTVCTSLDDPPFDREPILLRVIRHRDQCFLNLYLADRFMDAKAVGVLAFSQAIESKSPLTVRTLLSDGRFDPSPSIVLRSAIKQGDADIVFSLANDERVDVNADDGEHFITVIESSWNQKVGSMLNIITMAPNFDPNVGEGRLLKAAIGAGCTKAVDALLDHRGFNRKFCEAVLESLCRHGRLEMVRTIMGHHIFNHFSGAGLLDPRWKEIAELIKRCVSTTESIEIVQCLLGDVDARQALAFESRILVGLFFEIKGDEAKLKAIASQPRLKEGIIAELNVTWRFDLIQLVLTAGGDHIQPEIPDSKKRKAEYLDAYGVPLDSKKKKEVPKEKKRSEKRKKSLPKKKEESEEEEDATHVAVGGFVVYDDAEDDSDYVLESQ